MFCFISELRHFPFVFLLMVYNISVTSETHSGIYQFIKLFNVYLMVQHILSICGTILNDGVCYLCCFEWGHTSNAQGLFLLWEILLAVLREPYEVTGIKPRSASCRAGTNLLYFLSSSWGTNLSLGKNVHFSFVFINVNSILLLDNFSSFLSLIAACLMDFQLREW